ncbi:unnamed protein product [Symbiodinium microadriaticum]|nr:unnamed protein product [Symbiodinium microadriaticum]
MQENDVVFVGLFWSSFGSPFESPVWSARNGEPAQCQFLNLQLYVQVSGDGLAGAPSRCDVPVLPAFSCTDLQPWGKFLEQLQHNAAQGFPPDLDLLQMADDIVVRFQAKPAEAHPPEGFFNYICGLQEWPLPNQFCLLGYVSALFVRARHLMLEEGERETANSDLAYAEPILGKEISLDFLDSSPWPVSILDIFLNINQTDFLTYAQYAARNPVRPPSVPLESLHWQPPPDLVQRLSQIRTPSDVSVAVFGTHATLSLEPVDMLTRSQGFFRVKATFFGLEPRWCEILGLCNQGSSTITQLLRAAEGDPYAYPWDTLSQHLSAAAAGDQALREAQLLLCTEPVAGCVMLRQWASRERGATLPMLGYYGVALLNGCPPQDVKTFWRGFGELLDSGSMARMATNNLILSEQIFYQTGRRLPYVRAHGLYTEVSYSPTLLDQVLFWRSPLFAYATLRCAMFRFLEGFGQYPLKFYFLEGSESVPYAKAVSFRAIAMLPHDHALMSFYELYSTATPLLLPSAEWMYRLLYMRGQLSVGERWYQSIMPGHQPPYCEFEDPRVWCDAPALNPALRRFRFCINYSEHEERHRQLPSLFIASRLVDPAICCFCLWEVHRDL